MPPPPPTPPASGRIAALLPLSGPEASLGASMLAAIRLALSGSPLRLDVEDTGADAGGAARAAEAAVAAHDALILGPLTSGQTRAVSPIAADAGVPVLAFTSDVTAARLGVWVLGLTPEQQVDRLVAAARRDGRTSFAAFLPENALGDVMATAYTTAVTADGGAPPAITRHDSSFASINDGLKTLSAFASRAEVRDATAKAAASGTGPGSPQAAAPSPGVASAPGNLAPPPAAGAGAAAMPAATPPPDTATTPMPPPPFDTLLLADTATSLQEVIDLLGPYDVGAGHVRILGPALWSAFVRKLGPLAGAWYAAPDPAARTGFVQAYAAKNGRAPRGLDDTAFDAAALAAALDRQGGISETGLVRPNGFAGVDGVFLLEADGHVRRALAVFQVDGGGGSHIVSPAPNRLAPAAGPGGA